MTTPGNLACFAGSTRVLIFTVLAGLAAGPVSMAQTLGEALSDAPAAVEPRPVLPRGDAPPAPAETLEAYRTVQHWVRTLSVPEDDDPASAVPTSLHGASVTLRLGGQVIGRGWSANAGDRALARAAREALARVRTKVPPDVLADPARREALAAELQISLELAGPVTPLDVRSGVPIDALVSPGLDGILVRVGDRAEAVYPAMMLENNFSPSRAAQMAASSVLDDPAQGLLPPRDLALRRGAVVSRFRTVHLAQPGPGEPPIFLDRGGRVVSLSGLTREEIARRASQAADWLIGSIEPEARGSVLLGDAEPWRGGSRVPAGERDSAMALLALLRYDGAPGAERWSAGARTKITKWASSLLPDPDSAPGVSGPWQDPIAAAGLVIALAEDHDLARALRESHASALSRCAEAVAAAAPADAWTPGVPAGARGFLALALTSRWVLIGAGAVPGDEADARAHAQAVVRRVFAETDEGLLVGHMPWLAWAELRLAGEGEIPAALALRRVRDRVWEHQIRPGDVDPRDADLLGGIVFTAGRAGLPSWHSARAITLPAILLGEARLTSEAERSSEIVRLVESLRFVAQLQVSPEQSWMWPAAGDLGACRAAPWDQTLRVDATAFALLAYAEALRGLAQP